MADTLAALPSNLHVLWMDGNSFVENSFSEEGDLDPPSFAAALPALEVLTLNRNELRSFSTELPQSLTRLELDYAGLTSIAGVNWRELTSLEVVWLTANELGVAETVEQLPPSIRTLDMQYNGIESGNVPDSLADALPALETLVLSDNWFLGAFSTQLPRGLKDLALAYTGLTSINGTNWGDLTSLRTVDLR